MFEKKLYAFCALLSMSCSAYAIKGETDKDEFASSSSVSVRSGHNLKKSTRLKEKRAERRRLQALVKVETQTKETLLSELERLKAENEELRAQVASSGDIS